MSHPEKRPIIEEELQAGMSVGPRSLRNSRIGQAFQHRDDIGLVPFLDPLLEILDLDFLVNSIATPNVKVEHFREIGRRAVVEIGCREGQVEEMCCLEVAFKRVSSDKFVDDPRIDTLV